MVIVLVYRDVESNNAFMLLALTCNDRYGHLEHQGQLQHGVLESRHCKCDKKQLPSLFSPHPNAYVLQQLHEPSDVFGMDFQAAVKMTRLTSHASNGN